MGDQVQRMQQSQAAFEMLLQEHKKLADEAVEASEHAALAGMQRLLWLNVATGLERAFGATTPSR